MRVSLAEIQQYAKTLASLSDIAAERSSVAITFWMTAHPEATVAECREFAIMAVRDAVARYGDAAAQQAAILYDNVMDAEGVDVPSALTYDGPDEDAIEGTVRRLAGKLAGDIPDADGFLEQVRNLSADKVRDAASETVMRNVERDARTKKGKNIRFARIPQRSNPCPWCVMLASRGFDYKSAKSAAAGSHHRCTCLVVPGVKGKTEVDGYDPDSWYDKWKNPISGQSPHSSVGNGNASNWLSSHHVTASQRVEGLPSGRKNRTQARARCDVYTTSDGIDVIFPQGMSAADQSMTPEKAIELLERVPTDIRRNMQRKVFFVDYENPQDAFWRKRYRSFTRSYATGGDEITFYKYSGHDDDYVVRTYCHEAGHYIDKVNGDVSRTQAWRRAMRDDRRASGKESPTQYGENSNQEDFAESVACWATNRMAFEVEFKHRADIISNTIT